MAERLQYQLDLDDRSKWHIVTVHPTAKNQLVYVQEVGDFHAGRDYYTTREGLDSYLIKLTLAGRGTLHYENREYSLKPGNFFWINCQNHQSYHTDRTEGNWRVIWVHFWGEQAKVYYDIFREANQNSPVGHLTAQAQMVLFQLLTLYGGESRDLTTDVAGSALLCQLFSQSIASVSAQQKPALAPAVVGELKLHLMEHYAEKITLDGLAVQFAVSKYHMQRLFKAHMGQTPAQFLLDFRMAKAKELLRTTNLPIGEVAYDVGMENVSHFISTFRKNVGTPPQKFRQSWANME
ncbi:MAG: AraC family transcriptional regulator [Eubacteriales bacterium]